MDTIAGISDVLERHFGEQERKIVRRFRQDFMHSIEPLNKIVAGGYSGCCGGGRPAIKGSADPDLAADGYSAAPNTPSDFAIALRQRLAARGQSRSCWPAKCVTKWQ